METNNFSNNSQKDLILHNIYYDRNNPASFGSIKSLYKAAYKINKLITLQYVKNWLAGQLTYTLHHPSRRKWPRNKIIVYGPYEQWQADLTFLNEFSNENKNYKYLLTIIDCFSKFAYAFPLKNKSPEGIIKVFKKIFSSGQKPAKLQTDKGKEFDNIKFKKFLKSQNVILFTSKDKYIKCSIVERFNRTLKQRMFKIFTRNGDHVWFNKIKDIVNSYNNKIHRTTKYKPVNVNFKNSKKVFKNIYGTDLTSQIRRNHK